MKKIISTYILLCFFTTSLLSPCPVNAQAVPQESEDLALPAPGQMVPLSPAYSPAVLKGLKLDPQNPFHFNFYVDQGDTVGAMANRPYMKEESAKLIKYFLASLTIPEKDLWVNLSPYEKDRIIPASFGQTEMGRDLLAQDYLLKQITASLIYPESRLGKEFWDKVYTQAQAKYGTTNIPINTFNKVWIVPDKAVVYENNGTAFVLENHLKVMLEEDYLSIQKHQLPTKHFESQIIREIVIPALTKEVNEGRNFSQLRQVFYSLILATWYKKKIKDSLLNKIYADTNKIDGVQYEKSVIRALKRKNQNDDIKLIYEQYLKAFKKGVYSYIKEEPDQVAGLSIPRKYFSGGVQANDIDLALSVQGPGQVDKAQLLKFSHENIVNVFTDLEIINKSMGQSIQDRAMNVGRFKSTENKTLNRNGRDKNRPVDQDDIEQLKFEEYLKELGNVDPVERKNAAAAIPKLNISPKIILNRLADYLINPSLPLEVKNINPGEERRKVRVATLWAIKTYFQFHPQYQNILAQRLQEEVETFKGYDSRIDLRMTHEANPQDTLLDNFWLIMAIDKKYPKDTPYWWAAQISKFIYPDKGTADKVSNILYRDFAMQAQYRDFLKLRIMNIQHFTYDLGIFKMIKSKARGHVFYPGSGADISHVLLSTNGAEFDMVDHFVTSFDSFSSYVEHRWNDKIFDDREKEYLLQKEALGYWTYWKVRSFFNSCLVAELKALGMGKEQFKIEPLEGGFRIILEKQFPFENAPQRYVFNFIKKDVTEFVPKQPYDILYQKAYFQTENHSLDQMLMKIDPYMKNNSYMVLNPYRYLHITTKIINLRRNLGLFNGNRHYQFIPTPHYMSGLERELYKIYQRDDGYGFESIIYQKLRNYKDRALISREDFHAKKEGGINLNPSQFSLQINQVGDEFSFNFNGLPMETTQVAGISFVIYQIQPVTNLPQLLGLSTKP